MLYGFLKNPYAAGAVIMISNCSSPSKAIKIFIIILRFCIILSNISHLPLSSNFFPPLFCFPCHSPQGVNSVSVFHPFFYYSFFASSIKDLLQQYSDCVISAKGKFNTNGRRSADMLEMYSLGTMATSKNQPKFSGNVRGRRSLSEHKTWAHEVLYILFHGCFSLYHAWCTVSKPPVAADFWKWQSQISSWQRSFLNGFIGLIERGIASKDLSFKDAFFNATWFVCHSQQV